MLASNALVHADIVAANQERARALRRMSIRSGVDPTRFPKGHPLARVGNNPECRPDNDPGQKLRDPEGVFSMSLQRREVFMLRKTLIALVVASLGLALVSTDASARAGFRGGGFHRAGVAGGGWRGGGWRGGVAGAGWRRGGRGWRGPAIAAAGVGLGLASAAAWNANAAWGPTWGTGWGWNNGWNNGWNSGWGGGCTRWRQVWTGWGWRTVPVNVCW
jgi:hypothetical protein